MTSDRASNTPTKQGARDKLRLPISVYDRMFVALLVALTAIELIVLAVTPLNLVPDEAHYWEMSRRLDWSYYSKGPLVPFLIRMSCSLLGDNEMAVRLPAVLSLLGLTLVVWWFVRRYYGTRLAFVSAVLLRSCLVFVQAGYVITTDPVVFVFWAASLVAAIRAVSENRERSWLWAFVWVGVAVLAKYTALALWASYWLFLIVTPGLRHHLRSRGFLLGNAKAALLLTPVLIWNAVHGWVNVAHNAGHIASQQGMHFSPAYVGELLAGQWGLAGLILFPLLLVALFHGFRAWRRDGDTVAGILTCSSLTVLLACVAVSLTKRVYANWPFPAYIGALLLVVHLIDRRGKPPEKWIRRAWIVNAAAVVLAHFPLLGFGLGLPPKILPTKRLVGWKVLTDRVAERAAKVPGFLETNDYGVASEIAFYSKGSFPVLCDNLSGHRMNQYDLWGGWEARAGQDALVVLEDPDLALLPELAKRFQVLEAPIPVFSDEELRRSGMVKKYSTIVGRGFTGAPAAITSRR